MAKKLTVNSKEWSQAATDLGLSSIGFHSENQTQVEVPIECPADCVGLRNCFTTAQAENLAKEGTFPTPGAPFCRTVVKTQ